MYEYWLKCRNDACKTLECFDGKFSIMLLFTITCKSCSMAAYASELIERLRQHLSFTNMCQNIKEDAVKKIIEPLLHKLCVKLITFENLDGISNSIFSFRIHFTRE